MSQAAVLGYTFQEFAVLRSETIALSPALVSRTARALWLYSVIRTHLAMARIPPFFSGKRVFALQLRVAAFVPPHSRARALAVGELINRVLSVKLCRNSYLVRIQGLTKRDPCRARLSTAAGDRARPLPSGGNRLRFTRKEPPTPTTLPHVFVKRRKIFAVYLQDNANNRFATFYETKKSDFCTVYLRKEYTFNVKRIHWRDTTHTAPAPLRGKAKD